MAFGGGRQCGDTVAVLLNRRHQSYQRQVGARGAGVKFLTLMVVGGGIRVTARAEPLAGATQWIPIWDRKVDDRKTGQGDLWAEEWGCRWGLSKGARWDRLTGGAECAEMDYTIVFLTANK